jgi:hypothetical protein
MQATLFSLADSYAQLLPAPTSAVREPLSRHSSGFHWSERHLQCLWFDARYAAGRNRFRILRRRSSVALWVLSWEGPVGEYVTRWRRDVAACPRLALCPEGPGLLVKKILFRRKKQHL